MKAHGIGDFGRSKIFFIRAIASFVVKCIELNIELIAGGKKG